MPPYVHIVISGQLVLMDVEDALKFVGVSLFVSSHGYLKSQRKGDAGAYIHRLIMDPGEGMVVDHINGNPLDNRKSNLRVCSQAENTRNARLRTNNKTGVRGVYWDKCRELWAAKISANNKTITLGRFATIEEATYARRSAENRIHGGFSALEGVLS